MTPVERWLRGALAGAAATVPMTAFVVIGHRLLPRAQYGHGPSIC